MNGEPPDELPDSDSSVPPPAQARAQPARPLEYVRPGAPPPGGKPFPMVAGFFIGMALLASTAVLWVVLARSPWGFMFVPLIALVAAMVAETGFRWRGVLLGVLAAIGLTVLIPGVVILVICGGHVRL